MNFKELCNFVDGKKVILTVQLFAEEKPRGPLYPDKAKVQDNPVRRDTKMIVFEHAEAATSILEHQNNCIVIEEFRVKAIDTMNDGIVVTTNTGVFKISNSRGAL